MAFSEDKKILSFIESLEEEPVELDSQFIAREMLKLYELPSSQTKATEDNPYKWEELIARHFYELGKNAKEYETNLAS